MIDWPHLHLILGYTTIGSIALYLQYKTNAVALDKLSAAHERHVTDLREMIAILQLDLMHARETSFHARLNRVTHADLMEGAVSE